MWCAQVIGKAVDCKTWGGMALPTSWQGRLGASGERMQLDESTSG